MSDAIVPEKYELLSKYTKPVKKAEREIVGRDKEIRRIKAALMRPELCNVMLLAPPGSGKALDDGTLIPVADERGYVPIGLIKPGDYVYDETGVPARVMNVYPQGSKRAFEVTFRDGSRIVCNDEHLWGVYERHVYGDDAELTTKSLAEMMRSGINDVNGRPEWFVPVGRAVSRPHAAALDGIRPYVMGVLLVAGELMSDRICVCLNNEAVVQRVGDAIGAASVRRNVSSYKSYFYDSDGKYLRLAHLEAMAGGGGFPDGVFCDEESRSIPGAYLLGSIEQRLELFRGMMVKKKPCHDERHDGLRFESVSAGLACGMMELARSLGIRCCMKTRSTSTTAVYQVCFKVRPSVWGSLLGWDGYVPMDAASLSVMDGGRWSRRMCITSVRDLGVDVPMTCIQVDSPSHLFLAGREHIVTHNTAVVQGTMLVDKNRLYLEVDLSKMIADATDANEMAAMLKLLFDEVADFVKERGREIVLFIDEFHQIVQLSAAAVEALKPLLADSGTRGIRVIAATTYVEFRQYISPNQPLVERLQRINLPEADLNMTVAILRGMAKRYGVDGQFADDSIFKLIYEYTNRYMPSNAQPRKSLLVLDAMVGYHRAENRKMDVNLLADVIYQSEGVNIAFRVDATKIREEIDKNVMSQHFATRAIEKRLQICVADLNNKDRPMSSFLFSGSSGVGKTEVAKQMARILFDDRRALVRFDMSEFANPDSLDRFRRELTSQIWAKPYCVLLLDEIEKACAPVTRLLLQVLDDGRLTDENNRIVSFVNCYIILTTNAGNEVYKTIAQYNVDDDGSGAQMAQYEKVIRESITKTTGDNRFPPELLGRIDCIVPFQPLSEDTMKKIAIMNLKKLQAKVKDIHGVDLTIHNKVVRYLVEDNLDTEADSGGARSVLTKMESEVVVPVASYINAHPDTKNLFVSVEGTLVRDDKNKRVQDAYIVVTDKKPK